MTWDVLAKVGTISKLVLRTVTDEYSGRPTREVVEVDVAGRTRVVMSGIPSAWSRRDVVDRLKEVHLPRLSKVAKVEWLDPR